MRIKMDLQKILPLLFLMQGLFLVNFLQAQDYNMYKRHDRYYVMPVMDTIPIYDSPSATDALQFVLGHIQSGGNITLGKGVFELDKPIRFKSNVSLSGKRRATELRIKKPNPRGMLLENVENVHISNLTITSGNNGNADAGIFVKSASDCKVQDVLLLGFAQYGIHITGGSSGLEIKRSTFVDNDGAHIFIEETSNETNVINSITNSTLVRGGYGIRTNHKKQKGTPLQISGNMFFYTKGPAVDIDSRDVSLVGNRSYWGESDVFRIKGETFTITGNSASWNRGHSVVLDGARNGLISGNNWTDQGVRSRDGLQKSGIALYDSEGVTITGNSIWNFGDQGYMEYAVYEHSDCRNNSLVANTSWFAKHKNPFRLLGKNTLHADNTANKGVYRADYWDFTEKYGPSVDRYIEDLYLKGHPDPVISPDIDSEKITGVRVVECGDMLEQVLTCDDDAVKKFGWKGQDNQKWDIRASGESFLIVNIASGMLLQASGSLSFPKVSMTEKKGSDNQLWNLINVGNGYYKIVNKANGKVLQANGLNNYSWGSNDVFYLGQSISLGDYKEKEHQKWRFIAPMPSYVYSETIDNTEE